MTLHIHFRMLQATIPTDTMHNFFRQLIKIHMQRWVTSTGPKEGKLKYFCPNDVCSSNHFSYTAIHLDRLHLVYFINNAL